MVRRYDSDSDDQHFKSMSGPFVLYTDYLKLETKYENLLRNKQGIPLCELRIVAYSGSELTHDMIPTVVAPVFKIRDTGKILCPPFEIKDGSVIGGTEICKEEVRKLIKSKKITSIKASLNAVRGYELLIDDEMTIRYWNYDDARIWFSYYSKEQLKLAKINFLNRNFDIAGDMCRKALLADCENVQILALSAAINIENGNRDENVILYGAATSKACDNFKFDKMIHDYLKEYLNAFLDDKITASASSEE